MGGQNNQADIVIGLVQINNSFSGQNYLPYSVGLLESYTKKFAENPDRYQFLLPIYKRMGIGRSVAQLVGADIVGFSTYVWNGRLSLEIAKRIKQSHPDTFIVFGGPHVPDQPEDFLLENRFIDLVVHNEGEARFLEILQQYPSRDWNEIQSVSFINSSGDFIRNPQGPRFRDLENVPSPFLNASFDELIKCNLNEQWIGLWETNRGCPFRCTFCDWGSATAAKVTKFGVDRLYQEVDWFVRHKIEYIFCCDANFGIQKRDVDIAEYVAKVRQNTSYPQALSVQNTKNATERAYLTQKILSDAGLNKGVALSMQSVDMETLGAIKRENISLESYLELQKRFTRDKVETYSDLILGLPGETYDSFVNGINLLIENGQHNRIQFNNLSILPNAEMGDPEYQRKFDIKTVESEIINIHGERVELEDDVPEVQDLVIETSSMPQSDWRKVRSFSWMTALLYFDKIFQIPLMIGHEISGASFRDMIESFLNADSNQYPLIAEIRDFFEEEARNIQNGGPEYVFSKEWLGIYWPADEYIFVKMTVESKLDDFYQQAEELLKYVVRKSSPNVDLSFIDDALRLNRALIKQPFVENDISLNLNYDVMDFYEKVKNNDARSLSSAPTQVNIDRSSNVYSDLQEWCREVVWWGNKKGVYLYTNRTYEKELAGHY